MLTAVGFKCDFLVNWSLTQFSPLSKQHVSKLGFESDPGAGVNAGPCVSGSESASGSQMSSCSDSQTSQEWAKLKNQMGVTPYGGTEGLWACRGS